MKITFWGVRGSIPTPLSPAEIYTKIKKVLILAQGVDISTEEKIKNFLDNLPLSIRGVYGGNTPCVSVETEGSLIIFDIGSGARLLGYKILQMPQFKNGGVIHIFLSHTHWDHIQGLPFFAPAYNKNFKLIFYSPFPDIKERLSFQQDSKYFPARLEDIPSVKEFVVLKKEKETITIDKELKVCWNSLIHPGDSFAYKLASKNKSMVYATDTEFYKIDEEFMNTVTKLWKNTDVLIFDAQYTPEEYVNKISWGHSSTLMAVDVALKANAKRLVLFHHEPTYTDDFIENTLRRAKEYLNTIEPTSSLEIITAYEGLTIEI